MVFQLDHEVAQCALQGFLGLPVLRLFGDKIFCLKEKRSLMKQRTKIVADLGLSVGRGDPSRGGGSRIVRGVVWGGEGGKEWEGIHPGYVLSNFPKDCIKS